MKKILVVCLTVLMLTSMALSVIAAPGKFVVSVSGNAAPTVVTFDPQDDGCTATLVITPYSERKTLPETLKAMIEKAYDMISGSDDLTKLNSDLAKVAADMKIDSKNLAVSDLFDIRVDGCTNHDGHVNFDIVIAAETLDNFVGLLHMEKEGEFELVSNAEVINNGQHLKFSVDSLSPFAIVVNTTPDAPQTGFNSMIAVYVAVMAVSALALVVIAVKSRKQKA